MSQLTMEGRAPTEADDPRVLPDEALAALVAGAPWRRVVALGDSVVAGTREAVEGFRDLGWVDRVVGALQAGAAEPVAARNLARRDLVAAQIRESQLERAVEFGPDLAIVSAGANDLLRRRFAPESVEPDLEAIVAGLRAAGAEVLTIGLIDANGNPHTPAELLPEMTRRLWQLGELTQTVAARHGAMHLDLLGHPAAADPGIYATDGLHLNARGHAIVATETVRRLAEHLAAPPA